MLDAIEMVKKRVQKVGDFTRSWTLTFAERLYVFHRFRQEEGYIRKLNIVIPNAQAVSIGVKVSVRLWRSYFLIRGK
jgi:hypothetical protein